MADLVIIGVVWFVMSVWNTKFFLEVMTTNYRDNDVSLGDWIVFLMCWLAAPVATFGFGLVKVMLFLHDKGVFAKMDEMKDKMTDPLELLIRWYRRRQEKRREKTVSEVELEEVGETLATDGVAVRGEPPSELGSEAQPEHGVPEVHPTGPRQVTLYCTEAVYGSAFTKGGFYPGWADFYDPLEYRIYEDDYGVSTDGEEENDDRPWVARGPADSVVINNEAEFRVMKHA